MILAVDPSGNFNEGKGITGWLMLCEETDNIVKFGAIDASTSLSAFEHWDKHIDLIKNLNNDFKGLIVVIEDYILYENKASSQVNSRFETIKLIGIIEYFCKQNNIPLYFQTAVSVKRRWKNFLLEKKGYVKLQIYKKETTSYETVYINGYKVNNHVVDALRHAVHFKHFHIKRGGEPDENILLER